MYMLLDKKKLYYTTYGVPMYTNRAGQIYMLKTWSFCNIDHIKYIYIYCIPRSFKITQPWKTPRKHWLECYQQLFHHEIVSADVLFIYLSKTIQHYSLDTNIYGPNCLPRSTWIYRALDDKGDTCTYH